MEEFDDDAYQLKMPPVQGCEYLVSHWYTCGLYSSGASGIIPLSWTELANYSQMGQADLDGWEAKQIISMSRTYVSFKQKADEMGCPPPFRAEMTQADKDKQAKTLMSSFDKLKNM